MKTVVFSGHSRPIKDIQFNTEDDLLFTGSADRYVTLWSTETSERIGTYYHDAAITCMYPTKDSKYLISADNFGGIYIWEISTGKRLAKIDDSHLGIMSTCTSLSFGVSDREVLSNFIFRGKGTTHNDFKIFNVDDVLKMMPTITPNSEGISLASFSSKKFPHKIVERRTNNKINISRLMNNNKQVLCACENGLVQIIDIDKNEIIKEKQLHKEGSKILDLHLTEKEELAISSGKDSKSVLFDPENLDIINVFEVDNPIRNINSGKISPLFNPELSEKDQIRHCFIGGGQDSGSVTFTSSKEGGFEILIYDMILGEEVGSISGHFSPINSIAVSNSGRLVVSGGEEATVRVHLLNEEYVNLKEYDF